MEQCYLGYPNSSWNTTTAGGYGPHFWPGDQVQTFLKSLSVNHSLANFIWLERYDPGSEKCQFCTPLLSTKILILMLVLVLMSTLGCFWCWSLLKVLKPKFKGLFTKRIIGQILRSLVCTVSKARTRLCYILSAVLIANLCFFLFSNFRKGRLLYIRPVGRLVGWLVDVTINFFQHIQA